MKKALYFGQCGNGPGHFLRDKANTTLQPTDIPGLPWSIGLMDGGLLRNRGTPDEPDGKVHWTGGGIPDFWFAFVWWDRSGDSRPNSNSGFYVRGFGPGQEHEAFAYACEIWPDVVRRQKFKLELTGIKQEPKPLPWPPACTKCEAPLKEPGAIFLSPPIGAASRCFKGHLCTKCYFKFLAWLGRTLEENS